MDQRTLKYLSCIAFPEERVNKKRDGGDGLSVCGGELIQRDLLTLLCTRCETEYSIESGIPQLLPKEFSKNSYSDDDVIQKYYEMHFGPNIRGPHVGPRLSFPQPNLTDHPRTGRKIDTFADVRRLRQGSSKELQTFYESVAHLFGNPCLTEDFYQCILDLSQPLLNTESIVLDIGCGLGRMAAEIANLGAAYVIGLDRSPRMAKEAAIFFGKTATIFGTLHLQPRKNLSENIKYPSSNGRHITQSC